MYGNFKVLSNTGKLLFRSDLKKINWYLSKGLAKRVDDNTIQFLFQHKSESNVCDEFALSEKENVCVVCGTSHNLTRHHVIPYWYRKNFPTQYKEHSSHDVLPVCRNCHNIYENYYASPFKVKLASEYDVPFFSEDFEEKIKRRAIAKAILNHGSKMDQERREDLLINLAIRLGDFPSDEELQEIAEVDVEKEERYCHGKAVVDKVESLQVFSERWRQHFVDTMRPRYLPIGWDVKRSLEIDAAKP